MSGEIVGWAKLAPAEATRKRGARGTRGVPTEWRVVLGGPAPLFAALCPPYSAAQKEVRDALLHVPGLFDMLGRKATVKPNKLTGGRLTSGCCCRGAE